MNEKFDTDEQNKEAVKVRRWLNSGSKEKYKDWRISTYPEIGPYKYAVELNPSVG